MRRFVIALLAIGGIGIASPAPAQTVSPYPFCILSEDNPGWTGCLFNTYEQCQATASGTQAECLANPWYSPRGAVAPPPRRRPLGGYRPIGPPD
jgi:hypothetical protein